ncbi:ATP-NAD kinase [Tothia fuscella]|uniref:ATP-NAD kinase n=1 Tax=Tothia fuscella TaxID=1048955 RepID=A0A9P4NYC6_9PEZI|nr:ATP-NAD kinase [Tothia fuscella]
MIQRTKLLGSIAATGKRSLSASSRWAEIRDIAELPHRTSPRYQDSKNGDFLTLQWPSRPQNILLTKKNKTPAITESLIEFAKHIHSEYEPINMIVEHHVAKEVHESLPFPVYTTAAPKDKSMPILHDKVDLVSTLGGDGTILHASALFATTKHVPPIISFSMGTLGFLGQWKFEEYKRAFREAYVSGAEVSHGRPALGDVAAPESAETETSDSQSWSSIRGKLMGSNHRARVLLRNRLKVGIFDANGQRLTDDAGTPSQEHGDVYAMNEVIMHRGANPHLTIIKVLINGHFLTEAVADGMIISTPTGSTAYSLSSGGSIVHPLVSSLLLTPICPRSLSFRPLVLPANAQITLRLSEMNRGKEVEVSVDGVRRNKGLGLGMEVRVSGESVRDRGGVWNGGVPSIVRGAAGSDVGGDDHWVGGLNGLLKYNYPFGEGA